MVKKVVFLGMGGTIAGRAAVASDNVGYQSAQMGVQQLLEGIPALGEALSGAVPESEQVAQVDSKNMDWSHWHALQARALYHLQRSDVAGLIITHGTDTLEESAFFLSQALPADLLAAKPVVFTCAMRPATSHYPDGPQNLCDAAAVVVAAQARGVLVVCAGAVHEALYVQKVHPYREDAFSSGEAGPAGFVEEGRVRWGRPPVQGRTHSVGLDPILALPPAPWPRVEVVINTVGLGGATVRALCARPAGNDLPVEGIVVAGTGNGTFNDDMKDAMAQGRAQGVRIVVTTRCHAGQVVTPRGVPPDEPAYLGLSVVKARIALVLELLASRQGTGEKKAA